MDNRCKNCEFAECIGNTYYCNEYETELSREDFGCEKFLEREADGNE